MRPSPRGIYLAALTILVAAGVLLGARQETTGPAAAVPASCVHVPAEVVSDVLGREPATWEERTRDDVRFGRWLDDDGTVLVELRCARPTLTELTEHRAALSEGEARVVDTTPPTVLSRVSTGTILRQIDEAERRSWTWFVAAELSPSQARAVVEATRAAQETAEDTDRAA